MNTFLISPEHNFIEEVARHLTGNGRDYSSSLVVFPGKRPAHFLRKVLAERERTSFIPPRTFSMDEMIDFIYEEGLVQHRKKLETIDAVAILYSIHKDSSASLGAGGESFLTPDRFLPVGLKIYSDLEELYIEGITPSMVREIDVVAEEKIPEPAKRRLQSLSHFYKKFYERIEADHYSTRSSRYRDVSKNIDRVDLNQFKRIIFAGFFALTQSEKIIFKTLMRREEVYLLFQKGAGIDLSSLGIEMNPVRNSSGASNPAGIILGPDPAAEQRSIISNGVKGEILPREPQVHFYKSSDTHGQVFGLSNLLKEKIDQGEPLDERTLIVLPSPETLFPLLHHALSLLQTDHYNVSLGYPLQRTPLSGFFKDLMELILSTESDRFYVPYYLRFMLHPYPKNIYFQGRSDVTRMLFHAVEAGLTEKKTRKFISLSEIESDETVAKYIEERVLKGEPGITLNEMREHLRAIHANTIRRMQSFEDVGDFAKKLKEVIGYIYENSTARLHPFFFPYSESFITHLDLFGRSLMKEIRFEETGTYFNLIKRYLAASYVPFAGTPLGGIQVLGFLETRNIKFERVFFLDMNEGILPDTAREDSLLPFKVRQILGLPTYLDREKLIAYYLDTLIQGAREVHLFYVENDEKERSRFIERLLWERQKRERKSDDKEYVKTIPYSVTLQSKKPQPVERSEEMIEFLKNYSFSATSLDTYLRCPLRFYYQYVLGLREREIVSDELEREELGFFVHQVLWDYFKGKTGKILSGKDMDLKELEKIIRHRFGERYGPYRIGENYFLERQIENHLRDFIKNYQISKLKERPTRIMNLEQKIEIIKESFKLNARLDRIEKRGDRIAILDYKTSANKKYLTINYDRLDIGHRDSWGEVIGTLQLPFYLIAYSEAAKEKVENIDCMFLLLGRMKVDSTIELPLFQDEEVFKNKFDDLYYVIFTLLKEIIDPHSPFTPAAISSNCERCIYKHICDNSEHT